MIKALVSEGICNMRLFHDRKYVAMVELNNTEGCRFEIQDYQEKKEKHPSMRYKNVYYICITYITVFL